MDASDGWTGSRWWVWSSWDSSHEDGAAEHDDSWNEWKSSDSSRKDGAAEHDDSWQESSDAWRQEGGAWSQRGDAWSRMGAALDRKGGPSSRESESAGSQKDGHAWAGHLKPRRPWNNDAWSQNGDAWGRMNGAWDRESGSWSQEGGDVWAGHLEPRGRRDNDAWREPLTVYVGGLASVKMNTDMHGTVEEFLLGDFFHYHGCEVERVRLMVDGRTPLVFSCAYFRNPIYAREMKGF